MPDPARVWARRRFANTDHCTGAVKRRVPPVLCCGIPSVSMRCVTGQRTVVRRDMARGCPMLVERSGEDEHHQAVGDAACVAAVAVVREWSQGGQRRAGGVGEKLRQGDAPPHPTGEHMGTDRTST